MSHNKESITALRTALINFDQEKIDEILSSQKVGLDSSFVSHCFCGCADNVSSFDLFRSGRADNRSLPYLLEKGYISPTSEKLLSLLANLFSESGGNSTSDDNAPARKNVSIDFLLDYLAEHNAQGVKDYRDEYESTLMHHVFYGHEDNELKTKWFYKLYDIGCDIYAKTNRDSSDIDHLTEDQKNSIYKFDEISTRQGLLYLAVDEIDFELVQFLMDMGISANEYEFRSYWYGQNLLLKMLYQMRFCKDPKWIEEVCKIAELLINYQSDECPDKYNDQSLNIDLNHHDWYGLNVSNYLQLFHWDETRMVEMVEKYNFPDPIEVTDEIMSKLKTGQKYKKDSGMLDMDIYKNCSSFSDILLDNMYVKDPEKIKTVEACVELLVSKNPESEETNKYHSVSFGKDDQDTLHNVVYYLNWKWTKVEEILKKAYNAYR